MRLASGHEYCRPSSSRNTRLFLSTRSRKPSSVFFLSDMTSQLKVKADRNYSQFYEDQNCN